MSPQGQEPPCRDATRLRPVARALLSVSDKNGIVALARQLNGCGVELVSTGGTRKVLADAGLDVLDIADLTGFPEMMDGRLKALHPVVFGGLLAKRDTEAHRSAMQEYGIPGFDLLVANPYPFEAVVRSGAAFDQCIDNIDIGGSAMIRAAAKNHADIAVVVDPGDYAALLDELGQHGGATTSAFRRRLASKAFSCTAAYDAAISQWFARELGDASPERLVLSGILAERLRYGENPHQTAAFYRTTDLRLGVAAARQIQGRQLSYNNINDTDAAFECVAEFDPDRTAACVIVKHANPCGVAQDAELLEAYRKALATDPASAFGGVVAFNRPLDAATARAVTGVFTEVIIAPDASDEAIAVVAAKSNLRLLLTGGLPDPSEPGPTYRWVAGGLLAQSRDNAVVDAMELSVVTKRQPTEREFADLLFAFRVAKHVKSNAIVYARDGATVGIGTGQPSRVESARIGVRNAAESSRIAGRSEPSTKGAVVASDAYYPFVDGLMIAIEAGVTAAVQQGGSVRDREVIDAADAHGIAMVFTGMRQFRH